MHSELRSVANERIRFERLSGRQIEAAVNLRTSFVEHGLYSGFGASFWRLFMKGVVNADAAIAIAAVDDSTGALAGYVIGAVDIRMMRSEITSGRKLLFARACLREVISHPSMLLPLATEFLGAEDKTATLPPARWVTWIVDVRYRRMGVGLELYNRLCFAMRQRGVESFYGSVESSNEPSNLAHVKMGAHREKIVTMNHREHIVWRHSTASSSQTPT